ncbi:MAG: signal peptidase II [Gaiellaceae bacterium]
MRRVAIVLGLALPLAAVDLVWKSVATTPYWAYHTRSIGWLALSLALFLGALTVARVPSAIAPLAAGIMAGGVLGNAVSAVGNGLRVPDPIIAYTSNTIIAFNPADVFITVGTLTLTAALGIALIRHRHLLPTRQQAAARCARALHRRP